MKSLFNFIILLQLFAFSACTKTAENTPTIAPADQTTFNVANATLLKQGTFNGNMNYSVSGAVRLYEFQNKKYLYFENFSSNNGPDLKVYIATNNAATLFVSLGALKGASGTQTYEITNPPDFTQYNKVLIWCKQFNVLFGSSSLQ